MAKLLGKSEVDLKVIIELSEAEARWLDAVVGYGPEELTKAVKAHLGTAYIEKYEQAGIDFSKTVRPILSQALEGVDEARRVLKESRTVKEALRARPE